MHLRSNWATEKVKLIAALKTADYQLEAVRKVVTKDKTVHVWAAKDALVLKMLTIYLRRKLDPILSKEIYHLGGLDGEKRGTRAAARKVYKALPDNQFVFRTDVKGYYASIQHGVLYEICQQYIKDAFILKLI